MTTETPFEEECALTQSPAVSGSKIGRNDPCVCGSGKKYKKCCLAREEGVELEHVHSEACSHGHEG